MKPKENPEANRTMTETQAEITIANFIGCDAEVIGESNNGGFLVLVESNGALFAVDQDGNFDYY